jgi:hypothetical protein
MNGECIRISKKAVVAYFKILLLTPNSPGESERNEDSHQANRNYNQVPPE